MISLDNIRIELKNGMFAEFKYFSDFDNPIFTVGNKYKITIIDNQFYSTCGDDEPSCRLKDEFQSDIFKTMNYDFFKGQFVLKGCHEK